MKYMTPDLLARAQAEDDEVAESATAQWESACAEYNKYLENIWPALPSKLRSFLERFPSLHDAQVPLMGQIGESRTFSIYATPEESPDLAVVLAYALVGSPKGLRHGPTGGPLPPLQWLYDEIEMQQRDGIEVFTHSILFTGGREMQLSFSDLDWWLLRKRAPWQPALQPGYPETAVAGW